MKQTSELKENVIELKFMTDLQEIISDDLQPLLEIAEGKRDIDSWNNFADKLLDNAQKFISQYEADIRADEREKYYQDAHWVCDIDEETGKKFWRGGGSGDMDESKLDVEQPMILNPEHFEVGYIVSGTGLTPWINTR